MKTCYLVDGAPVPVVKEVVVVQVVGSVLELDVV